MKLSDTIDYVTEVIKYNGDEILLKEFKNWIIPKFPLNGKILKENGLPPGRLFTPVITKLKEFWIANDYKCSTEDLIKLLPSIIEECQTNKTKTMK